MKNEFGETRANISQPDKTRLCGDKRYAAGYYNSVELFGLARIDSFADSKTRYSAFIKQKDGSCGIFMYKEENGEELKDICFRNIGVCIMKNKKVCFITTVPITIKSFILPFAEYIHEKTNWYIYMICNQDDDFKNELPEYITYLPVPMKRGANLAGIKAMLEMVKIFKREKFDLIQYSTPNASLYAAIAGAITGVPVRLYCQWGMAYVGMSGIKRKIFKQIEKLVCYLSTRVEPDSKSNLKFAHEEGLYPLTKGAVIGEGSACGVDLEKFDISKKQQYRAEIRKQYHLEEDSFVFGFVGRITKDKGINELLTAFRKFIGQHRNCYLLIVGNTENPEALNQKLYNWSLKSEKIIYVGSTSHVEKFLSAMDCYVLPSYREGFGMGTIEAEAMGLPVIVTEIPGPIDAMIPGGTGLIVKKEDSQSLHDAMVKMMDLDKNKIGRAGYQFVKENFEQKKLLSLILKDRESLMKV